jgi:plasmid stability protein
MAQLIVRNLEPKLVERLRLRAARRGRSAEAEHREILREALTGRSAGKSLKQRLLEMPSVGRDADFARPRDLGRPTRL